MSCLLPRSLHLAHTSSLIISFVTHEDVSHTNLRSVSTPGSVRVRIRVRVKVKVRVRVRVSVRVMMRSHAGLLIRH